MSLDNLDTSHWLLENKDWSLQRKEEWRTIEPYFKGRAHKAKKAITIIKRYFLKGDLPDFKALQNWQSEERHLDIFCFLWLHPSWDKEVLIKLRDDFASDSNVSKEDVLEGIGTFNSCGTIMSSQSYHNENFGDKEVLNTDGHNQLLFEILISDKKFNSFLEGGRDEWNISSGTVKFDSIITMTAWLTYEKLNNVNQDCLYQYSNYLEYWATQSASNTRYFEKKKWQRRKPFIEEALVRIADFDTKKEGDSPRTRSVIKLREIFDEYDFSSEISDMWFQAKAGTLKTKGDPWVW